MRMLVGKGGCLVVLALALSVCLFGCGQENLSREAKALDLAIEDEDFSSVSFEDSLDDSGYDLNDRHNKWDEEDARVFCDEACGEVILSKLQGYYETGDYYSAMKLLHTLNEYKIFNNYARAGFKDYLAADGELTLEEKLSLCTKFMTVGSYLHGSFWSYSTLGIAPTKAEIEALADDDAAVLACQEGSEGHYSDENNHRRGEKAWKYYGDFACYAHTEVSEKFKYDPDPNKPQFETIETKTTELYYKGQELCTDYFYDFVFSECYQVGDYLILVYANKDYPKIFVYDLDNGPSGKCAVINY